MGKPHVLIISPALAKANNGNWQTAHRWARFLREHYRLALAMDFHNQNEPPALLIALHARRSAKALADFSAACPGRPSILVLTGTDLYRDIRSDADAQHSLKLATRLVVLQEAGLQELDKTLQEKSCVIHQSATSLKPIVRAPRARHFDVTMIGHLREEKDPQTFMRAAAMTRLEKIRMIHIGGTLDASIEAQAKATQQAHACYRWLGNLPHGATRQRLKRSHLMVIASSMEGGANVIIEAITSGVPVLASDISGNRGMLGADYAGYFALGDAQALVALIERASADSLFYVQLQAQCAARAPLFTPEREKEALLDLVDNCMNSAQVQ